MTFGVSGMSLYYPLIFQVSMRWADVKIRAHESGLNASPRLSLKLRETGCRSYAEYLVRVQRDRTGESLIASIARAVRNRSKIHIWCAASSTGEEPYTLAFSLLDSLGPVAYKSCPILATDISTRALGLADQGIYSSAHLEACRQIGR